MRGSDTERWSRRARAAVVVGAVLGLGSWMQAHDKAASAKPERRVMPSPIGVDTPWPPPMPVPLRAADIASHARTVDPLRIVHERGVWRIHADAASRYDAARVLADLSATRLPDGIEALRSTRPLHLRWEGRELATAWQAIIGSEASYALRCSQRDCTAWIVATGPPVERRPFAPPTRPARSLEVVEASAYD